MLEVLDDGTLLGEEAFVRLLLQAGYIFADGEFSDAAQGNLALDGSLALLVEDEDGFKKAEGLSRSQEASASE